MHRHEVCQTSLAWGCWLQRDWHSDGCVKAGGLSSNGASNGPAPSSCCRPYSFTGGLPFPKRMWHVPCIAAQAAAYPTTDQSAQHLYCTSYSRLHLCTICGTSTAKPSIQRQLRIAERNEAGQPCCNDQGSRAWQPLLDHRAVEDEGHYNISEIYVTLQRNAAAYRTLEPSS